jgi:HPt (histidine-containing phosphotransfer) domain-containing protein
VTDPLAPLREKFRLRSVDDLARLKTLLEAKDEVELRRLAHGIAGAAGTFGFPALSEAAVVIDDAYMAGRTPSPGAFDRLQRELEAVAAPKP